MSKSRRYSGAGFLDGLTEAVGNLMPGNKKDNAPKNNSANKVNVGKTNAAPVNNAAAAPKPETVTFGFKPSPQAGGVASVTYNVPGAQRQPSEEIMEWATTAGAPTPTTGMRNVAHGGARRTRRNRNKTGGSRRNRNRSRRNRNKSGGSRRNRNRSRRNKTGGSRRNRNRSRRNRTRRNRN
jgi:hypothetical protein